MLCPPLLAHAFRPEIQARHNAFQRGSAYLERYCMLIVFTAYLQVCGGARAGAMRGCLACWTLSLRLACMKPAPPEAGSVATFGGRPPPDPASPLVPCAAVLPRAGAAADV